jgi:hypothetical protein
MNLTNERKLAARAKQLGESADAAAFAELAALASSESALVRRLAGSALGKLAGIVDAPAAVEILLAHLADTHPQVRQYAAKALAAYGTAAEKALPVLCDLYRNPAEKDYVKRSVAAAGKTIRAALELAESNTVRTCGRCGKAVEPDEYARSQRFFQRTYCDVCMQDLYMHAGKLLISLYPEDKTKLDEKLGEKLQGMQQEIPTEPTGGNT